MLRELISRFTSQGPPPPVLSQVSQLSLSQRPRILLAKPSTVAKVASVAVAIVENSKIKGTGQTGMESKEASALAPETGLVWLPGPPADDGPDFAGWWGAFALADLAKLYNLRVVAAGSRVLILYPPKLQPDLVSYAEALLDDARSYLVAHRDKLPHLTPADAATAINEIMRQHRELRFCRGDDGSRWPLYPTTWTAGQKATVQSLWLVAGDALDADSFSFERVEP